MTIIVISAMHGAEREPKIKRIERAQDQADLSARLALFDVDDPFAADPDLLRKGILVEVEAAPPIADGNA